MVADVREWLEGLGLGQYTEAFAENYVDADVLLHLANDDLNDLGVVAVGHRRKLLDAISLLPGRDLPAEEAVGPAEPSAEARPEGERRQVTVLFADISGYTKLSAAIDAEEAHALLGRFFDRSDAIIRDHGGTVDKHIGDSVMAVFGAPVAHGNDPERAVRAAEAIRQAMPELAGDLGRPLQVHIGVASGQVVASGIGGDAHYTVIGDSVNLAARLTDTAGPGEILIAAAVHRAVAEIVEAEDQGEIAVKGLTDPERAHAVRGLRAGGDGHDDRPFVGRRAEARQFTGALDACLETGVGQAVYLRGEAGIGKTRLVEEFQRLATVGGFACHRALALDFGVGKGQDPIRTLVRSLLEIPPGSGKAVRAAAAEQALAQALLGRDRTVHLNDLLDLPQSVELRSLYDAMDNATRNAGKRETVAALVQRLSERRPLMVVVEDLHWADSLTLDHLAQLARTAAGCRLLLAMTSRIEGDPLDQAWRGSIGGTPLMTVDLGPLREDDAMALAAEYLDATSEFALSCIERAAGNPLFLEQLLRSAGETGDGQVPGSVQSIVQARLDNLAPADKSAIQAASVLGQRFSLAALRHLIESGRYTCAGLIEHNLVRPEGDDFLFAHALVQEGVLGSLLKARRQALHGRAADWFAGQDPALRAGHLERAGDPQAARAFFDAAEAEFAAYRFERALRLSGRGLSLAVNQADAYDLTCQQGEILRELGDAGRSIEAYERALSDAANDVQKCRAWIGSAEGMRIVDRIDDALALLDKAQPVAETHRLLETLMRLHHLRGNLFFAGGNVDGCKNEHQQSLAYAREVGSAEGEARGLGGLGDAAYASGRMRTAHDELTRCVEICRQHGLGRVEVANSAQICHTKIYLMRFRDVVELALATIEAAGLVGHARAELNSQSACYLALIEQSEWHRARQHIDRTQAIVDHLGALRFRGGALAFLGRVLKAEGSNAEALACAREAVQSARETRMSHARLLGCLARVTDDRAEQDSALAEAENVIAGGCVGHNQLYFYRDAIEVSLQREDWDEVERYAQALADFVKSEPLPWSDFFIARGRALAAIGRGRRDEATIDELKRLRDEAERIGLKVALPALKEALTSP